MNPLPSHYILSILWVDFMMRNMIWCMKICRSCWYSLDSGLYGYGRYTIMQCISENCGTKLTCFPCHRVLWWRYTWCACFFYVWIMVYGWPSDKSHVMICVMIFHGIHDVQATYHGGSPLLSLWYSPMLKFMKFQTSLADVKTICKFDIFPMLTTDSMFF